MAKVQALANRGSDVVASPTQCALRAISRGGADAAVALAARLPRIEAVWVLDDALRRGVVTRAAVASRASRRGRSEVLARLADADGQSLSIVETAGRLALVDAGLPRPDPRYRVCDGVHVDAAYPDRRLCLVYGGGDPPERWEQVVALRWRVLRFDWWDVTYRRAAFVRQVREALIAAA